MKGPLVAITRAAVLLGAMAMMRPAPASAALAALDSDCGTAPTAEEQIDVCEALKPEASCTVVQIALQEVWNEERTSCMWQIDCVYNC